jgi:uncharacterized Zn-finger protein
MFVSFRSTYCEKRFTNSGDLQIHVRIHTVSQPMNNLYEQREIELLKTSIDMSPST